MEKINSNTVSCSLVNIQTNLIKVVCRNVWKNTLVNGLDLKAGRTCAHLSTFTFASGFFSLCSLCSLPQVPPNKPQNVRCETWRNAPFLECMWERGQETHLDTTYNISVSRCGVVVGAVAVLHRACSHPTGPLLSGKMGPEYYRPMSKMLEAQRYRDRRSTRMENTR